MREADLHPERRAEQRQRVVDVIPVPDERDHEALEPTEPLAHREDIREGLARMLSQRQAVDDRDLGLGRQLDRDLVRPRPDDDRVDEPIEVTGDISDALTLAEHHVMGQVDRVATQLGHPGLEGDPRAQARLLEQHRQRPAGERRRDVPARRPVFALERRRRLEDTPDLIGRQIRHTQQIPPAQRSSGVHLSGFRRTRMDLPCGGRRLTLRVLRCLTSSLESVLLAFLHPWIAGEQSSLAERKSMALRVELEKCSGDPVADRAGLPGDAAALDLDHDVEATLRASDPERQSDIRLVDGVAEVLLERAAVHHDLALSGQEPDAGDGRLASTGAGVESWDRHRLLDS